MPESWVRRTPGQQYAHIEPSSARPINAEHVVEHQAGMVIGVGLDRSFVHQAVLMLELVADIQGMGCRAIASWFTETTPSTACVLRLLCH